ncbi:MAG: arginine--tRNA ligase [Flavobacteriales bacterium]|nr:MAG: arginine--tRNA ligase [Flavobacteriales bacterium]CAI8338366.1 MAG: Arginine--tRNA ligase [Flavobacteriales bacterium]|tara:strand:- start:71 stop:1843 length:1773 start_codon:yes stop_codon:yes gene_type:complete
MEIKSEISSLASRFLALNYSLEVDQIEIQNTKKDFKGDITIVLFPFYKEIKKDLISEFGKSFGENLVKSSDNISGFNIQGGFLNLDVEDSYYLKFIDSIKNNKNFGKVEQSDETYIVEFSSPNTNKPLHLGHIRNNLLGYSIAKILEANGKRVKKVQIINDRGIHICKSIISWKLYANGATPESENIKGDKFVGEYYIMFDKVHKEQMKILIDSGMDKDLASENTSIMKAAKEELSKWESNVKETREVWKMMNDWVYKGFEKTYNLLGVSFDKNYYESETYLLGKNIIEEGLQKNILYKRQDSSVWINLDNEGLDEKLLLRSDGTSVYMTQDLGTAVQRISDNSDARGMIYTVGNEQDYHFKVLFKILKRLGYQWADNLFHLSYGMVDLPSGKMKSREGTVVDADDLIYNLIDSVKLTTESLEKFQSTNDELDHDEYKKIALGALKYYILKVDPKKNILFNPDESIDLTGNTGPFIQYAYVRIQSILKKVNKVVSIDHDYKLSSKEKDVLILIHEYPSILINSYKDLSPAIIANYLYELVKSFNSFYQNHHILNSESKESSSIRISISIKTSSIIESACDLLGIDLPKKM